MKRSSRSVIGNYILQEEGADSQDAIFERWEGG